MLFVMSNPSLTKYCCLSLTSTVSPTANSRSKSRSQARDMPEATPSLFSVSSVIRGATHSVNTWLPGIKCCSLRHLHPLPLAFVHQRVELRPVARLLPFLTG